MTSGEGSGEVREAGAAGKGDRDPDAAGTRCLRSPRPIFSFKPQKPKPQFFFLRTSLLIENRIVNFLDFELLYTLRHLKYASQVLKLFLKNYTDIFS